MSPNTPNDQKLFLRPITMSMGTAMPPSTSPTVKLRTDVRNSSMEYIRLMLDTVHVAKKENNSAAIRAAPCGMVTHARLHSPATTVSATTELLLLILPMRSHKRMDNGSLASAL